MPCFQDKDSRRAEAVVQVVYCHLMTRTDLLRVLSDMMKIQNCEVVPTRALANAMADR